MPVSGTVFLKYREKANSFFSFLAVIFMLLISSHLSNFNLDSEVIYIISIINIFFYLFKNENYNEFVKI